MIYVLDACALLAFIRKEAGHDVVRAMIEDADNQCFVHAVNLCEVFYSIHRESGEAAALSAVGDIRRLGINISPDLDDVFWQEAGRLKSIWRRVSLADCFAIALTNRVGGELITSDHHELDPLAAAGVCPINFFR
ncbi:MAG: type II toxin-antitoxin system VapC family toxin [Acidobacteriota bacterium]